MAQILWDAFIYPYPDIKQSQENNFHLVHHNLKSYCVEVKSKTTFIKLLLLLFHKYLDKVKKCPFTNVVW